MLEIPSLSDSFSVVSQYFSSIYFLLVQGNWYKTFIHCTMDFFDLRLGRRPWNSSSVSEPGYHSL
jgi:hypothetical protein